MHLLTSAAHAARFLIAVLVVGVLSVGLVACDSGGDNGNPLDGDLRARIQGPSGLGLGYSQALFSDTGVDIDGTNVTIPDDGSWEKDLEDGPVGVELEATTAPGESVTLQLLSDGEVVKEDSSPEDLGGNALYSVEVGEVRDVDLSSSN